MQNHKLNTSNMTLSLLSSTLFTAMLGFAANSVFAQAPLQAQGATPTPSNRAELANTVGELLRLDAAAAVDAEKNKNKSKPSSTAIISVDGLLSGDSNAATNLIKPKKTVANEVEPPKPAPVIWLSELSGISGERRLRFNQMGGRNLMLVEGSKTTDATDPQWKLLAVQGRCAQFERTESIKKAAVKTVAAVGKSQSKKQTSVKSTTAPTEPSYEINITRHEACYTSNPPSQRLAAVPMTPLASSTSLPPPVYIRP
jgi:hypothetical protein